MDPGEPALLFRGVPLALRVSTQDKGALKNFAVELSKQVGHGGVFTCLIANDKQLRKLNRDFLGHDHPTDVLSFPSGSPRELGDLAISAERAQAQAEEFGHSLFDELRLLMLHGVLHLSGFDHETDRGEMKRAERRWREVFGLPSTLTGRTAGVAQR